MSQAVSTQRVWRYQGIGPSGPVEGRAEAADEVELDAALARDGITLVKAKRARDTGRDMGARMSSQDLVTFTTQLATVLNAGVPIVEGMRDLGDRMRGNESRKVIADVVRELESGASLSAAMGARPRSFPMIYRASVEAGEASGAMPLVLQRLADHMEWTRGIRQTMTQALVYPAVLGLAILGLVVTLVTFLVPRIVKMFPGGVDELPSQTAQMLALSRFVTNHWPWIVAAAVVASISFMLWVRTERGRIGFATVLLSIPRVGDVVRMFAIAKFAATAGTLQNAGCQIADVIRLGGAACGNARMARSFFLANERIQRGATISEALSEDSRMDPLLLQMVSVGERAGDLGGCLDRLGEHYDRELPRMVKWMLSFLEPFLLIVGGIAVAYSLFAALLPLLDMYERL